MKIFIFVVQLLFALALVVLAGILLSSDKPYFGAAGIGALIAGCFILSRAITKF